MNHQSVNPEQAVAEYMGDQFIEWLQAYIPQNMVVWPIILKIRTTKGKPEKVRKFILQIFLVAEAFLGGREGDPGFLRFAIANLSESDDPQAETALEILEKRREDELVGHKLERGIVQTQNREAWLRLLHAIGLADDEIDRSEPKEHTRNLIAELSDLYSNSDWQIAAGAFVAHELIETELYKVLLELLKNNFELTDKELAILNDRIGNSQRTSMTNHILDKVVFDQEAKELVWQGIERVLTEEQSFLQGLEKYLES